MKWLIYILFILVLAWSCGKKDNTIKPEPVPVVPVVPPPLAAVLDSPKKNEECTTGTIISAIESAVPFRWANATNAESYEITVKNLETNMAITQTVTATTVIIALKRNTPYSWFITSKSGKTTSTAISEVWKFYNSGPANSSYAPFPAEIISPNAGQTITANGGKVSLKWSGSDVDNDILVYDVYFGTSTSPAFLRGNITESELPDLSVTANTTYYWKVVSRDPKGNTSDSGVSFFKIN